MSEIQAARLHGKPTLDPAESPLGVFDSDDDERLDADLIERVFDALLAIYPDAPVGAHTPAGVMVPMPASIGLSLKENPVQEARSGIDLIELDEGVIKGWERTQQRGAAQYAVKAAGHQDVRGTVYAVDLRENHGVIVTLAVMDIPDDFDEAAALEPPELAPRFATLWKNEHGQYIKADEATTRMLGFSEEELIGHRSLEFIHPDDHPLAVDNWVQMLAVPGPARRVRLRHRRRDGSWAWLELTNHNLLHDPDYECMVSEIVDISEEMAAHELVDRLAEAVPVGLLQVNGERLIEYSNDRLHEILGVERTAELDALLGVVVERDREALEDALAAAIDAGQEADVEVEVRLPQGGELRRCSVGLRPVTQDHGLASGAIACIADITDSARMRDELQRRATYDELTGVYNRAAVMRLLEEHVSSGRRAAERAVMFLDVDGFKGVNDRLGHAAGDELLRVLAGRLREALRDDDIVGRMGGDEFLIVCPGIGGPENAQAMVERLLQRDPVSVAGRELGVQISIGVAWSAGEDLDAESLVASADHAMYESKRAKYARAAGPRQPADRN
jgi:diguanylate cyclase (GGDEF)-like protein/PAS domain S-box-containing protein